MRRLAMSDPCDCLSGIGSLAFRRWPGSFAGAPQGGAGGWCREMVQQQLWPLGIAEPSEGNDLNCDDGCAEGAGRRPGSRSGSPSGSLDSRVESEGRAAQPAPPAEWWSTVRDVGGAFTPDAAQAEVLAHESGPLLVLGGPGTGKSRVLGELVRSRLTPGRRGLPAEQVLMLTSGRAAAAAWRDQLAAGLPAGAALPEVASFHSFAFGILRAADPLPAGDALRLLTAAEQEARLRELLAGATADGRLTWPVGMAGAVGTKGIAEEVRKLLSRARGFGLDGKALRRLGRTVGVPAWEVLGPFLDEYLDVLGFEGSIDYGELLYRAVVLANDERLGARLRAQFRLVVVDEFQDVEPIQVALLRALTRQGAALVVAGDPDQAVYGFRGGDVRALLHFPERFPDAHDQPARVIVLETSYRCRPSILSAAGRVRSAVALAPLSVSVQKALREPRAAHSSAGPAAAVQVRTYAGALAEASAVADLLWRERVAGHEWSQMAVIVRSPAAHFGLLSHTLGATGIPVLISGDDLPLAQESAVAELLRWLTAAAGESAPGWAAELLTGPIGRADPVSVRIAARDLAKLMPGTPPSPHWNDVLAWAIESPAGAASGGDPSGRGPGPAGGEVTEEVAAALRRCGQALAELRSQLAAEATPHELLWTAWQASDWPARLREQALRGGAEGRRADRQLDAVLALFDVASRMPEQSRGEAGLRAFVADVQSREVPTDRWGRRASLGNVVELLSAHRAKGRTWPVVVMAGVQDGEWPNPRVRSQLLRVGEVGPRAAVEPPNPADLLREERRLFYLAATRASEALIVTAVADPAEGGSRPSRFLSELGVPLEHTATNRGFGRVSPSGVVTGLRELAQSAKARGQAELTQAAAARLAELGDRQLGALNLPQADERGWWEVGEITPGVVPVVPADEPINLSGSAVAALRDCPLRWFLDRRSGAGKAGSEAMAVGLLMHALAEQVVRGDLPAQASALNDAVDEVWPTLPIRAAYHSRRERDRVSRMIASFLRWHQQPGRQPIAVEHSYRVCLDVPTEGGPRSVRLRGFIDRIDQDADGGVHLVDFKTARMAVTKAVAAEHPQLAVYQLAAEHGALAELDLPRQNVAVRGAELIFLSAVSARSGLPTVRTQAPCASSDWVAALIGDAAHTLATEDFRARPGAYCKPCPYRRICPAHQVRLEVCDEVE